MKVYYRKIRKYKYQLTEDFGHYIGIVPPSEICTDYIHLDMDGYLCIKKGYCWDGASGPTWDTKSSMRGGLTHDAIYQLIRMGLLPPESRESGDDLLYRICIEDGMWKWRAKAWRWAVKTFASSAAELGTQQSKIYSAGK